MDAVAAYQPFPCTILMFALPSSFLEADINYTCSIYRDKQRWRTVLWIFSFPSKCNKLLFYFNLYYKQCKWAMPSQLPSKFRHELTRDYPPWLHQVEVSLHLVVRHCPSSSNIQHTQGIGVQKTTTLQLRSNNKYQQPNIPTYDSCFKHVVIKCQTHFTA